jgi:hypothetical protein
VLVLFDTGWVWPLALLGVTGAWLCPAALPVALVYLHPLAALGLLNRELARSRPAWLPAYRAAAACVLTLLVVLVWWMHDAPDLPGDDPLTAAIARQAGGGVLLGV